LLSILPSLILEVILKKNSIRNIENNERNNLSNIKDDNIDNKKGIIGMSFLFILRIVILKSNEMKVK